MERNWLIRTTQYQILGPISKDKVIEFFKKGALGPDDEICSGNGYWFSIKEKDLIDKYLLGDIPQGYNPISEAPTVLAAKSKTDQTSTLNRAMKVESPDQTLVLDRNTLNNDEAENSQSQATQVINLKDLKSSSLDSASPEVKVPKTDDLDYPDMSSAKVPTNDDLDYPSISTTSSAPVAASKVEAPKKEATAPKYKMQSAEDMIPEKMEPVHLPKEEDLAYPDLMPTKNKKDFKIDDLKPESGLKLAVKEEAPKEDATKTQFMATSPGSSKGVLVPPQPAKAEPQKIEKKIEKKAEQAEAKPSQVKPQEDRKLFVERKKASTKESATQEINTKDLKKSSKDSAGTVPKRNDTYFFLIVALLVIIILGVLFYYREILNKPLPV